MINIEDLKKLTSKTLASYVVSYRVLGINKELSVLCMEELLNRRSLGEKFNFEDFIEKESKSILDENKTNISGISKIFKNLKI